MATTITARDIPVIGIDMRDGLIESRIRGLCEISPGRTGILTAGSVTVTDGITFNSYTPDLNSGIHLPGYDGGVALYSDGKNLLWIKKGGNLYGFNILTGKSLPDPLKALGKGLESEEWSNFFIDSSHRTWVITLAGDIFLGNDGKNKRIGKLPGGKRVLEQLVATDSSAIFCYRQGYIDVIDIESGELQYGGAAFSPAQADSLTKNISVALRGDSLYIAHDYNGISKGTISIFNLKRHNWERNISVPFHINALAVSPTDGSVYAAGDRLAHITPLAQKPEVEYLEPKQTDLSSGQLSSLLIDSKGGLWIGAVENGLFYHNPEREGYFTSSPQRFNFGKQTVFSSPEIREIAIAAAPGITNCALELNDSSIYVGTRHGLLVVDKDTVIRKRLTDRLTHSGDNIQSLVIDMDGDLWLIFTTRIGCLSTSSDMGQQRLTIYGKLDGIDLDGKEFLPGEILMDSCGIIHVGFPGGTYSFSPDKIKNGSIGTSLTMTEKAQTIQEGDNSFIIQWLILSLALLGIILLELSDRKVRPVRPSGADGKSQRLEALLASGEEKIISVDEQFLSRIRNIVDENLRDENLTVQRLSELMAMDRTVLYRRMQALTGASPSSYIKTRRMKVAARLLTEGKYPVATVAEMVGFSNPRYFSKVFKDTYGTPPNLYSEKSE